MKQESRQHNIKQNLAMVMVSFQFDYSGYPLLSNSYEKLCGSTLPKKVPSVKKLA